MAVPADQRRYAAGQHPDDLSLIVAILVRDRDLAIADVRRPQPGIVAIAQLVPIRQIDRPDLAPWTVRVAELQTTWVGRAGELAKLVENEARAAGLVLERGAAERRVEPDARRSRRRIHEVAEASAPRVRDLGQQPRGMVPVE